MGAKSGIGILLSLALAGGAAAQDAAHHPDWRKCRKCLPALGKAMAYLKANLRSDSAKRVIGSKLGGYVFGGFAFMMDGASEKELEDCVRYCRQAVKDEGFNRNWYLSMSMIFLAEYATRCGLTPEVEKALAEGLRMAERQQEETGGWNHHLLFWKESGYNTKGGGKDLGMVTAMLHAALVEMKALGCAVGPVMERSRKNLETISDGMGVRYGTDNNVGDAGMARASWVLLGLLAAGQTADPLAAKYARGLDQRYKKVPEGVHGFAPLHYFSVAAAMHRLGAESYSKFAAEYLDRLIATQRADGVVPLENEDDVASTAVFACIVMMQKDGAFRPPLRKKPGAPKEPPAEKKPVATAPAKSVDPRQLADWDSRLAAKVRKEIAEGRPPRFRFRVIGEEAAVTALDETGALKLRADGASIDTVWPSLTLQDRRDLAVGMARRDEAAAWGFAAFYLLACGDQAGAQEWLRRLTDREAEELRKGVAR
jgi:hypothetical protein